MSPRGASSCRPVVGVAVSHSARWFLGAVLAGCGAMSAEAQQSPSPAASAVADTSPILRTGRDGAMQQGDDRKDGPWKSFSEITKNATVQTGLFTIYRKRDNAYLSVTPD